MIDHLAYKRASATVYQKLGFYWHLASYVVANAGMIFVNLWVTPYVLWFYWPLAAWGIGLAFHWFAVFWVMPHIRLRMIEQEVRLERQLRESVRAREEQEAASGT